MHSLQSCRELEELEMQEGSPFVGSVRAWCDELDGGDDKKMTAEVRSARICPTRDA